MKNNMINSDNKEVDIKKVFFNNMIHSNINKVELKNLITTYSYFLGNVNKNCKYNSTYLESYCDLFFEIKENIKKKNYLFIAYIKSIMKYRNKSFTEFAVSMDQFWIFQSSVMDEVGKTYKEYQNNITHTGIIDIEQLREMKIYLDCKYKIGDSTNYAYTIINIDDNVIINIDIFVKKTIDNL